MTKDPGTSENAVSQQLLSGPPTTPSRGSSEVVRNLAANGDPMPKRRENAARVVIEECHRRVLNTQAIGPDSDAGRRPTTSELM